MAGPEGLLYATIGPATSGISDLDGLTRGPQFDDRNFELRASGAIAYRAGELSDLGFVDEQSPTVRLRPRPDLHLLPDIGGRVPRRDRAAPEPRRFAAWSRRYVGKIAIADALIGALATVVPASFSGTLSQAPSTLILLGVVGAIIWPLTIGLSRGYQRTLVGVGSDELRAVLRAAVAIVVAGAFPAGLLDQRALLTLVVVATPMALSLSLITRFVARKVLHRQQRVGRNVRSVIVVGSPAAAHQLRKRLDQEPHCGMKVIGVCIPRPDIGPSRVSGGAGPRRSARRRGRRSPGGAATPSRSPPTTPLGTTTCASCPGRSKAQAWRCWSIRAWWRSPVRGCISGR